MESFQWGPFFFSFFLFPGQMTGCLSPPTPKAGCTQGRQENQGCRSERPLRLALGNFGHMQNVDCFVAEARSRPKMDAYSDRWTPWLHHRPAPDPPRGSGTAIREGLYLISNGGLSGGSPRGLPLIPQTTSTLSSLPEATSSHIV